MAKGLIAFCLFGYLVLSGCAGRQQVASIQAIPNSGKFREVMFADLDRDGFQDVIGGGETPGTVAIWYGNGSGSLVNPLFLPLKADVRSIATADFNEDGLPDLVLSVQGEASGIMVWENGGNKKWSQMRGPIEINAYEGIRTADLNKDGHMDVIAANFTTELQGGIQAWMGDGNGGWSIDRGPTIIGRFMDVAVADFNEDGYLDIAGSGWGTLGALRVWLGTDTGGWIDAGQVEKGNFNRLSVADVDGDGHVDILGGTYRSGIRIWFGKGDGSFPKSVSSLKDGSFWKVLPGDLDRDGRLDLLAGSMENRGVAALRNRGGHGWSKMKGGFPDTGTYYGMVAGDLNRDGFKDIGMASHGEGIKISMRGGDPLETETSDSPSRSIQGNGGATSILEPMENAVFKTIEGVPEYKIGPGDTLEIKMWKGIEATTLTLKVRPEGKISFGLLENLYIVGLTARELDTLITERLKEFIKVPRVDVLVTEHYSKFIKIMGPGYGHQNRSGAWRVALKGKTRLLEAISQAGSLHRNANLSRIRLQRKSGQSLTVDLFKVITLGETDQDVILDEGDLVYIPIITESENRVYVFGEVGSPGSLAFAGTEFRLLDAIIKAGGVTMYSTPASTKIVRGDPTRPAVISVDLEKLMEEGDLTQNVALTNGDFVFVPRSFIGDINLFLQHIQPLLRLAYTPSYILDIPTELEKSYQDSKEAVRFTSEEDEEN